MEVVEVCTERKHCAPPIEKDIRSCNVKATKRYVQPPRAKSFTPVRLYRPPSKPLDTCTTYHLSYVNTDHKVARCVRAKPYRPIQTLIKSDEKFSHETTTTLSYKPVWGIVRTEPIKPKFRNLLGRGALESVTTTRYDYAPKYAEKLDMIIPCGSIRTSTSPLDANTTTGLSYVNPGIRKPPMSFKPVARYCRPNYSISKDTTQKLSYQPFSISEKEKLPWAQKPLYKPPSVAMCRETVYSESFLDNKLSERTKPCVPTVTNVLPCGAKFLDETIYKGSYLSYDAERTIKIVPPQNIFIPNEKISSDTTTKLSYRPVWCGKRSPILPRSKRMIPEGSMESETTNRRDFVPKVTAPPKMIAPLDNIRIPEDRIVDETTTGLSYLHPGATIPVQSFKPDARYCRPTAKMDTETINKLSFQAWAPIPKMDMPWVRKSTYEAPKDTMATDTIYEMSYPPPGYYVESECTCPGNNEFSTEENLAL